jgi:hypothetical protein
MLVAKNRETRGFGYPNHAGGGTVRPHVDFPFSFFGG